MALSLSPEQHENYTNIIDDILEKGDLTTITRKTIVTQLEDRIGHTTSEYKNAVKALIVERFDAAHAAPTRKRSASEQATDDAEGYDTPEPSAKKKQKRAATTDTDAELAAQLQAQEDSRARGRATRGGGARASAKDAKKKTPVKRKKSAARVGSDEDSNVEDGGEKKRRGGGFQKPLRLSVELSAVCGGEEQMSRPQVVKKVWEYIKGKGLQDPSDKRQIICDDNLSRIFGEKTNAFGMNKVLSKHLYPVEE